LWQGWKLSNVRALLNSDETSSAMKKAIWAAGYKELVRIFQSVTAVDHDWKVRCDAEWASSHAKHVRSPSCIHLVGRRHLFDEIFNIPRVGFPMWRTLRARGATLYDTQPFVVGLPLRLRSFSLV